ncbi:DUF5682 family protein [Kitasatospora sp. SUK 42]|uniref:DUF5682 family protein n=1 Tax=Kitasatospora sp. SUK 42 TaxID=1588882 RepID=UPI0018CBC194|nr:DUF5682 family protein [Kitasatospora sp. SUK 42]MBV2156667.1 hypothetical protein [Kitasatospora sp. SUK 42]
MPAVFLGIRHHSPACARLVADTVRRLRPAYVLVEGPADLNGRLDELTLGHRLPIAVFSHYRDADRTATTWAPLCDYSPEWVALREGRAVGAEVLFVDLPSWHPAFELRANRYADAEARYAEATARLCERFGTGSVDALWDGLFEVAPADGLAERLDAYFDLVRGDADADEGDRAREAYMADWVRAVVAEAGAATVLVVTGGFHTPALRALAARPAEAPGRPALPAPPPGAVSGSYLVPYSFRQLDAFAGYQSGMPSPAYYQQLWEDGPEVAADHLRQSVVARLRGRHHPVSTADLVAAAALTGGLAALRGHPVPARTDVLDGLAGALVKDDLPQPLPWSERAPLAPGSHPVVVEMVAACSGSRTGRLHPDTPAPPLVHDAAARLAAIGATGTRPLTCELTTEEGLAASRTLHRLRVLGVPGRHRTAGPAHGGDPVTSERWEAGPDSGRDAALIEAGAYGATLDEAAATVLAERARTTEPTDTGLAALLFDTVLCGATTLTDRLLTTLTATLARHPDPGALGGVLSTALGLWRHDRVYGTARSPLLASVIDGAVGRILWLVEGAHGRSGTDPARLAALVAVRDALRHAPGLLTVTAEDTTALALRIARDPHTPADLRGAARGLHLTLAPTADPGLTPTADPGLASAALHAAGDPGTLGDWLAGLFALAREEVSADAGDGSLLAAVDSVLADLTDAEFLTALPALRQAFAWFPPRERERIARRLIERRGLRGSARALLRTTADPLHLAAARALEENVTALLDRHGLRSTR